MKELYIAEKSSAGKDIARVLGLTASDLKDGYMENESYVVSWARGHLVGLKEAKELYDDAWSGKDLPFKIDVENNLKILDGCGNDFKKLKNLINREDISVIVNAGDSGREGELIQQWIYKMAGNKKPIKRLWTSSLTDESIKKATNNLEPNEKYKNLYEEGKALKVIDWLFGMNYSVLLKKCFGSKDTGALNYGRCQTPLLKLICDRENEINEFKKEKYYILKSNYDNFTGTLIELNNETKKYEVKKIKLGNEEEKKAILGMIEPYKEAKVVEYTTEDKEIEASKCFSLTTLQQLLGQKYGYTPDKSLELAQSLYEKKLTTYPRTNSEYLTSDVWNEKDKHIDACIEFVKSITNENIKINKEKALDNKYVDNEKVEDHHAIIPTEIKANISDLSDEEKNAYIEICKRFISIFMEAYKYKTTQIVTEINEFKFKTNGTQEVSLGYKELYKNDEKEENKEDEYKNLPELKIGDIINVKGYELKEQETKPKSRYNVSSILKLMEQYGIGTPATQSEIINRLIKTGNITIVAKGKKKEYSPTEKGKFLINIVPDKLKEATLTKNIEEKIGLVGKGKMTLTELQLEVMEEVKKTIEEIRDSAKENKAEYKVPEQEILGKCPFCNKDMVESKIGYSHKEWKDSTCKFIIFKNALYTNITKKMAKELLEKGETVGSFKSKEGKAYKQKIRINKTEQKLEKGEFVN